MGVGACLCARMCGGGGGGVWWGGWVGGGGGWRWGGAAHMRTGALIVPLPEGIRLCAAPLNAHTHNSVAGALVHVRGQQGQAIREDPAPQQPSHVPSPDCNRPGVRRCAQQGRVVAWYMHSLKRVRRTLYSVGGSMGPPCARQPGAALLAAALPTRTHPVPAGQAGWNSCWETAVILTVPSPIPTHPTRFAPQSM